MFPQLLQQVSCSNSHPKIYPSHTKYPHFPPKRSVNRHTHTYHVSILKSTPEYQLLSILHQHASLSTVYMSASSPVICCTAATSHVCHVTTFPQTFATSLSRPLLPRHNALLAVHVSIRWSKYAGHFLARFLASVSACPALQHDTPHLHLHFWGCPHPTHAALVPAYHWFPHADSSWAISPSLELSSSVLARYGLLTSLSASLTHQA